MTQLVGGNARNKSVKRREKNVKIEAVRGIRDRVGVEIEEITTISERRDPTDEVQYLTRNSGNI